MKKIILTATVILSIFILGCGGGKKDATAAAGKPAEPVKEVKKELVVTMKIGEEELKFSDASFLSNAMTPADETTKYTLYATPEGGDKDALNIEFDSAVKEEPQEAYISLKKYKIVKSELIIDRFEEKKGKVTAAKAEFSGQLKKTDENGFPTGELIDFNGTFEK
ncbi:MAG: hypothetical protein JXN63_09210 [Candidatus Delongbacteria bacterium]|nr:hypothetical protein [Candidatus Delongbacteria bacterium]